MSKIRMFLLALAAVMFVATEAASAAPLSAGAICKAAGKTSLVSKVHCRVVRKCGPFGCSNEEVCN